MAVAEATSLPSTVSAVHAVSFGATVAVRLVMVVCGVTNSSLPFALSTNGACPLMRTCATAINGKVRRKTINDNVGRSAIIRLRQVEDVVGGLIS